MRTARSSSASIRSSAMRTTTTFGVGILPNTGVTSTGTMRRSRVLRLSPAGGRLGARALVWPGVKRAAQAAMCQPERGHGRQPPAWRELGKWENRAMDTAIDLPDSLARAVRLRAVKEGRDFKDAVTDLVRIGLAASGDGP